MLGTGQAVVVTAVFAVLGGYAIMRAAAHRSRPLDLVGDVLHALMCAGMIVMAWPLWTALPAAPQLILYAVATAWYVLLGLLMLSGGLSRRAVAEHGPIHQLQHAVMMLAMVWMVVTMSPMATGGSPAGTDAMDGMAGMHLDLAPSAVIAGIVLTAALGVSGLLLITETASATETVRAVDGPGIRARRIDLLMTAGMFLGMALVCWAMLLH